VRGSPSRIGFPQIRHTVSPVALMHTPSTRLAVACHRLLAPNHVTRGIRATHYTRGAYSESFVPIRKTAQCCERQKGGKPHKHWRLCWKASKETLSLPSASGQLDEGALSSRTEPAPSVIGWLPSPPPPSPARPHVHLAVHRRRCCEVLLGLLSLARAPVELAEPRWHVRIRGREADEYNRLNPPAY
jgi:hypothetical protein